MKFKHWWKNFIQQEILKEINSSINGPIQIIKVFDKPRMMIGGMIQSGGMVRKIWEKAINKVVDENIEVKNALIIGLGCGNCAFEIQKNFPKAKITGVEIDKHVIDSAKCFFDLTKVKNLKISIDDGVLFVNKKIKSKLKEKFDLIIVDVFLGREMPKSFKTKKFFLNLNKLMTKDGVVVINHLFFKKYKVQVKKMIKDLDRVFGTIKLQRTASNLLIFSFK
ncbi:MAG: methyltransferase domain-containing protein [Candidatus Beckwithbacteria bacterium]|nr:methyltransferase domain-containing protein [Patescibacteria group bacterium]